MERLLTIKDEPMFKHIMEDPHLCKGVIECILGRTIGHIEYQNTKEGLACTINGYDMRLDSYVEAAGQVFALGIQTIPDRSLGRCMSYYQAVVDSSLCDKGVSYCDLPESFVIFICDYDPYHRDCPVYRIEWTCIEDPSINVGDKSPWIVLNSAAWRKEKDVSRANLLRYIQDGEVSDALTKDLAYAVKNANDDVEWKKSVL